MAKKRPEVFDSKFFLKEVHDKRLSLSWLDDSISKTSWSMEALRKSLEEENLDEILRIVCEIKDWTGICGAVDLHELCSQTLKAKLLRTPHATIFMQSILSSYFSLTRSVRAFKIQQKLYDEEIHKKAS